MTELVRYERRGSIAILNMDDGKANAIAPAMQAALHAALDQAQADGVVVVLTGRPGVFSAGFDLKVMAAGGETALGMLNGGFALAERMLAFPLPIVAACPGHALAMGSFLLLATDYRVGALGDYKIGANEVAIGMVIPYAAMEICRQRLLPAHFARATVNAEIYAPAAATNVGFLDEAVPESDVLARAIAVAESLSQLNLPAHAASKLRTRGAALEAIKAARTLDDASYRATLRLPPAG